jgi:tetratricopeptide (TPR) repeat protein
MIVRDEQDVLADSIESVRSIVDEIVILDTGSRDRTVEIAQQAGATVHRIPWKNHFGAARNQCLQHVTGQWVLWLDAGERLAADQAADLRRFVDTKAYPQEAYALWIEAPPREPGASAEQVAQLRLMPGGTPLRFQGRIRETLTPSIRELGMATGVAPGRLLRHPRQHESARSLRKAGRDLALASLEAGQSGQWPPRLLLAGGQAQSILGAHDEARAMLRRAVRSAESGSVEMLEAYYALLSTFDGDPELHTDQLAACLEALAVFPFDTQLLLALGNFLLVRQRLDLGIRTFEAAMQLGTTTPEVWHLCEIKEIAAVCLASALQAQQRDDEARRIVEAALEAQPGSLRLQQHRDRLSGCAICQPDAAVCMEQSPAAVALTSAEAEGQILRINEHVAAKPKPKRKATTARRKKQA